MRTEIFFGRFALYLSVTTEKSVILHLVWIKTHNRQ